MKLTGARRNLLSNRPIPGFHNFTGSNLSKWNAAKAARAAGTRNVKIIDWSDSTGAGYGATPTNANAVLSSRTAVLASLLGNASISSFFSDHNVANATSGAVSLNTFDSRINLGSWVEDPNTAFGGPTLIASASTPLTFAPLNSVDSFDIYYTTDPGFGSMSYQIDSGTVNTVNQNITLSVTKVTATATLGTHTLKLAQVSGAVGLVGVVAYNSAAKEFSLINPGYCGATSTNLTDTTGSFPWLNAAMVTTLGPDLSFIEGGQVNDWVQSVSRSTSLANLQTMITTAKASGDVILTTANPSQASGTGISYATQQGYVDDMIALAIKNAIPCIDIWRLFGSTWETSNANGLNFDTAHPNGAGYAQIGGYFNRALTSGFRSVLPGG